MSRLVLGSNAQDVICESVTDAQPSNVVPVTLGLGTAVVGGDIPASGVDVGIGLRDASETDATTGSPVTAPLHPASTKHIVAISALVFCDTARYVSLIGGKTLLPLMSAKACGLSFTMASLLRFSMS